MNLVDQGTTAFRRILLHMAQTSQPFVYHCSHGKDRTGVMSMLLLLLAEVDHETIAQDYALTQLARPIQWDQVERVRFKYPQVFQTNEDVAHILDAKHEWMLMTLERFHRTYGDITHYLTNYCGLTLDQVDTVRKRLLE
jgi:protein tyrosine phosphatase